MKPYVGIHTDAWRNRQWGCTVIGRVTGTRYGDKKTAVRRNDWPLRLAEEYLESTASYRLMKQRTVDLDQVEAVALIWTHSWYDKFDTWGLGASGWKLLLRELCSEGKRECKAGRWEGNCWYLFDFCLVCSIELSYRGTITLYLSVCATVQEYSGTLIHAGHSCCSGAAERLGTPWDHPCLSARWFGFPPLCQHFQVWKCVFMQSLRGQRGNNILI